QTETAEDSDRHRKIEGRPFLLYVRGTEVNDDALIGRTITVVANRRKDPVLRFSNRSIGQANDHRLAIAPSRQVHFDIDEIRFDSINSGTTCFEKHVRCGGIWGGAKITLVPGLGEFKANLRWGAGIIGSCIIAGFWSSKSEMEQPTMLQPAMIV